VLVSDAFLTNAESRRQRLAALVQRKLGVWLRSWLGVHLVGTLAPTVHRLEHRADSRAPGGSTSEAPTPVLMILLFFLLQLAQRSDVLEVRTHVVRALVEKPVLGSS